MTIDQVAAVLNFARKVLAEEITSPQDIARAAVGLALDFAPVDMLAPYLTEEARRRDDLIVDRIEAAKLGED